MWQCLLLFINLTVLRQSTAFPPLHVTGILFHQDAWSHMAQDSGDLVFVFWALDLCEGSDKLDDHSGFVLNEGMPRWARRERWWQKSPAPLRTHLDCSWLERDIWFPGSISLRRWAFFLPACLLRKFSSSSSDLDCGSYKLQRKGY